MTETIRRALVLSAAILVGLELGTCSHPLGSPAVGQPLKIGPKTAIRRAGPVTPMTARSSGAIVNDYSLIQSLDVDDAVVNRRAPFYFTVTLERAATNPVALFESFRAIRVDGTLGIGFYKNPIYVPAWQRGETFSETATLPDGSQLPAGSYLLTVSQGHGAVTRSVVVKVILARRLSRDTPIYTPIVDVTNNPPPPSSFRAERAKRAEEERRDRTIVPTAPQPGGQPAGPFVARAATTLVPPVVVTTGHAFSFMITTETVNFRDPAHPIPGQSTLVTFRLYPLGSTTAVGTWTDHLRFREKTDTYFHDAKGDRGNLPPGDYVLTAVRTPNEKGEGEKLSDNYLHVIP